MRWSGAKKFGAMSVECGLNDRICYKHLNDVKISTGFGRDKCIVRRMQTNIISNFVTFCICAAEKHHFKSSTLKEKRFASPALATFRCGARVELYENGWIVGASVTFARRQMRRVNRPFGMAGLPQIQERRFAVSRLKSTG